MQLYFSQSSHYNSQCNLMFHISQSCDVTLYLTNAAYFTFPRCHFLSCAVTVSHKHNFISYFITQNVTLYFTAATSYLTV